MEWMTLHCSPAFTITFLWKSGLWCWSPVGDYHAHHSGRRWGDSYSLWDHSHNLLDTRWKAHHREEEPICVEVLKHPLHRLPIDAERDAGHSEVQATAHHVIWFQQVLVDGGYGSGNAAWWAKNKKVWLKATLTGRQWKVGGMMAHRRSGHAITFELQLCFPKTAWDEQWAMIS